MEEGPRLTEEQEKIRMRGLRILARMIARAHLNQSQGGMCICRRLRIGPGGSQERLAP